MTFEPTDVNGAYIVNQDPFADERGYFTRLFCEKEFAEQGIPMKFVQSNLCVNKKRGTLRGLHLQKPVASEDKMVICTRGKIFDVCADARQESPTFGQTVCVELSEKNGNMLYIPKGCAHGYLTLEDNSQLLYLMSEFYIPSTATGYRFDDPFFSIKWPLNEPYIISEQDLNWKHIGCEGVE